jgi:DNA-damage-inducible protein D
MTEKTLPVRGNVTFEEMKKINDHGAEYWSARDLQPLLGYSQWRRFEEAVQRAITHPAGNRGMSRIIILPASAK